MYCFQSVCRMRIACCNRSALHGVGGRGASASANGSARVAFHRYAQRHTAQRTQQCAPESREESADQATVQCLCARMCVRSVSLCGLGSNALLCLSRLSQLTPCAPVHTRADRERGRERDSCDTLAGWQQGEAKPSIWEIASALRRRSRRMRTMAVHPFANPRRAQSRTNDPLYPLQRQTHRPTRRFRPLSHTPPPSSLLPIQSPRW
jgi:hypothetical protein